VRQVTVIAPGGAPGNAPGGARRWTAYEIHAGHSETTAPCVPLHTVEHPDGTHHPEGLRSGNILGTYLHGYFEAPETRAQFAALAGITAHRAHPLTWSEKRQAIYCAMSDHIAEHLDLAPIRRYLGL
ncbi:MAG: hypothetical protein LBM04_00575, partial [Opitutaceae bacterium]|nr:hypothetical protein [Opitutaceae bacterium]